ncbi:MAG: tRNA pseudouridine(55) synthase TruB [Deltaproteobacteria bacterium]|nr:tRNA pseudouridine(55) synthase TruB [Deltaproteobacteria bacterium]
MDGIVVLDKPKGMTSLRAVSKVKTVLKTRRAGHTGTLDPFATGVLPICVGKATKVIPFLDEDFKEYEALLRLGITTDTMDATGRVVIEKNVGAITRELVIDVFSKFKGKITQIPPMFSALKKDGVRLYKLAREGKSIERPPRTIIIKDLELIELNSTFIKFFVNCSRGTYIRVLGSDIGDELGCGGHLVDLRRIRSGRFKLEDTVSLENVKKGDIRLIPISEALSHIKDINVGKGIAMQIKMGMQIRKSYIDSGNITRFEAGDKLKIYENSDLVSVGEALVSSADLDKLDDKTVVLRLLRVLN